MGWVQAGAKVQGADPGTGSGAEDQAGCSEESAITAASQSMWQAEWKRALSGWKEPGWR